MTDFEGRLLEAKSIIKEHPDEAARICNDILNEDTEGKYGGMALFMLGYIMLEAERYGLAYHIYNRCAQLKPDMSEIYSNMGMTAEYFNPKKAEKLFQKAHKLKPSNANALANEGLMCLQTGRPEKCIKLSQRALDIDPELKSAKHNMGLAQLMVKDWGNGWRNYADTLGVKHREIASYGLPEWSGETGKRVLVYGEQGVGDEIMFASCLEEMAKDNDIVLDADARLSKLFARSFDFPVYGGRFTKDRTVLDNHEFDYQCAIGQLPVKYRLNGEFSGKPYLTPNPERCIQWRALFDTYKGKKIGLAWSGGLAHTGASKRTLQFSDVEQLIDDDNTYISLEYNKFSHPKVKSFQETLKGNDIDLLAGLIAELDLVITACTAVVYIAGALGIPCHVLVPSECGYRYHKEGTVFPWYNSVKLFRQNKNETWFNTVKRFKGELNE